MKKSLLLVAILILSQLNALKAQTLFNAPDTVCVFQPVTLTSNVLNASSYYWGFCSGDITADAPTGNNLGSNFQFHGPSNIEIARDFDGNYYGFVVNADSDQFLRLNYGTSLSNIPTVTNFGNLTEGLPHHPQSLYVVYDTAASKWFVFVSGGYTQSESTVGRIDFLGSLSNPAPNIANFGNFVTSPTTKIFNWPKGLFIAKDPLNSQWFGYLVNRATNELIRMDFSYNISNTPIMHNLGNVGGVLSQPTDLAGIYDNSQWFFYITNRANNTVSFIHLGRTLDTLTPYGETGRNFNFRILEPSSVSLTRDCGKIYAFITDSSTSQLVMLGGPSAAVITDSVDYSVVGGMNYPTSISTILRDHDDLTAFVTNSGDSSLTKINISHCTNSSIPSFTEVAPPNYVYDAPGVYNVYMVINQGLPNMQVQCKEITVLPKPTLFFNNDTTLCQGDTLHLFAVSNTADSFVWGPAYNIDTVYNYHDSVRVYPAHSTNYTVEIFYPDGCIVDTVVKVHVSTVVADAGPDRVILDGSSSTIGGPNTSLGGNYTYLWTQNQFISDTSAPFPVVAPPYDYTYALTVTEYNDAYHCQAFDTVVVHVECGDFYLPNAFAPGSGHSGADVFGILNKQITNLNYFRIFDRWGQLVFQTTDPTQRWDGTYNGQNQPEGVYVWEVDGFCVSGQALKKHGNVTLIR